MDPFTQRMLERAKARREKLDNQLSNAGHEIKQRRSPLKDTNALNLQASKASTNTFVTPEKDKKIVEKIPDKENGSQMASSVKSKLERLGKLYSDDRSHELSSPIHRTEEKFCESSESSEEIKGTKRHGARLDRLAALASTINNWEDDLSHPQLVKNKETKAEKIHTRMNEQVMKMSTSMEPQPTTSRHNRWKSNGNNGKPANNSPTKHLKWDKQVLNNLESQGFTRTQSNSRLVYDFKACSQESKTPEKAPEKVPEVMKRSDSARWLPRTPDKAEKNLNSSGGSRSGSRFGGFSGSPKNIITSPGSVLSKASLFESKSLATKAKDPAEMSLSERMALFERNKGEALIPKAPLTLSVPTNKLQETSKSSSFLDQSRRGLKTDTLNQSVKNSRALIENGLLKQGLENDILHDIQMEKQKELEMLRSRFKTNKEVAQVAAGSCIRPRNNSEGTNESPKSSPVCPVKPTPVTDHIPPPPPLPQDTNSDNKSEERITVKRQVIKTSPKPGSLYPDLTELESPDKSDSELETSLETSVLNVVTRQAIANKRQIESDDESSTSDISVLDEMDEYLDECLANQEVNQEAYGPTPPKLNRGTASPSMSSSSFKYSAGFRSPIKVTDRSSIKKEPYIVEGNSHVPLMHSVSFYRRQQSTPKTPVRELNVQPPESEPKSQDVSQEATLVTEKIKRLKYEVCKQQTIISQASQALNLCTATVEFSGSREQVEGERLLLIATHRRQAVLNEIQRLKIEGSLQPVIPGESMVQESGSLTISALTLPLKRDYHQNREMCLYFLCLIRHLDTVIATPVVQAEPGDSCVRFPSTLKLDDLYSEFKITIEVYSLETRAEILPHEIKYHINNTSGKTPKKKQLIMPVVQSPAGPSAVRSPAFTLCGYVIFSLKEVNRQQFTLNKVPRNSSLEGHLQMHVSCELSISVEHRGFLTMFEDVSGFGAWHRRWCLLKGDTLSYWKYPDDERKKTPIGSLELQGVVTKNVGLVSRDICARPNTFLLETVRPSKPDDNESMTVVKNGSLTTIRHLLSADTKEERLEWCNKLNRTLNLLQAWGGAGPGH